MSTLLDSPANDEQPVDIMRANKRAKFTPVEEDMGMFRNIRLSLNELPMEPLEPPDPSLFFDSDHHNPVDISNLPKHNGDEISGTKDLVDFNSALSYVNKVKHRFCHQPDTYKQFLETLQVYQDKSTPIRDVHAQLAILFSSAPDILEDFRQFLPYTATQAEAQTTRTISADADKGGGRKRQRD
jgi:histone deacetylase complex regulatory component SIN3